jgi:flavin reductase (DIM6/NTAB) family NADH-FMN oxidoreductase RutF
MSRSLGPALPPDLLERLSQRDLAARLGTAIPVVTLDPQGRPHPMLCSHLEVLAVDPTSIRLVIAAGGRSAANLEARGLATLLIVEPGCTVYVKCRAGGPPMRQQDLERFDLRVEDVLEDAPADWEGGPGITSGIRYGPTPTLEEPWAKATLALLRSDRAG